MADEKDGGVLRAMAAAVDLVLPPETVEGVRANRALLEGHAANLADFPLPDDPRA